MKNLTLGSLFSGSGGFELAGMLAGITPVWNSEIEPYPILVTHNRLPNVQHFGDVSKLNGAELPPVDIVTFGSPCQDMSVAGKRNGLDGSRSGLFHEAVRIIREMRCTTNGEYPRFIVWENVCFDEDTLITCENGCKGVLVEKNDAELAQFALLFEFEGDKNKIRHVLYCCSASRPKTESSTKEESTEVKTETLSLKSTALPNGLVKCKTCEKTDETTYNNWYKSVYIPNIGTAATTTKSTKASA